MAFSLNAGGILYQQESITLKEKGISILKEKVGIQEEKSRNLKIENATVFSFSLIAILSATLGLFTKSKGASGDPSGILSYFHLNGAGLALGLTGLLWSYILIALLAAVLIVVIGAIAASLGL